MLSGNNCRMEMFLGQLYFFKKKSLSYLPDPLIYISSNTRCCHCEDGYCLPSLPGQLGCDWTCGKCGNVSGQEVILATLARCRSIIAMDDDNLDTGELILNRSVEKSWNCCCG